MSSLGLLIFVRVPMGLTLPPGQPALLLSLPGLADMPARLRDVNGASPASLEKEMATHSSVLAWRIPWLWCCLPQPGALGP